MPTSGRGRHVNRAGLQRNLLRILRAKTTGVQDRDALARLGAYPKPPGTLPHWVFRDDERKTLIICNSPLCPIHGGEG
jgi:hypothetical protein